MKKIALCGLITIMILIAENIVIDNLPIFIENIDIDLEIIKQLKPLFFGLTVIILLFNSILYKVIIRIMTKEVKYVTYYILAAINMLAALSGLLLFKQFLFANIFAILCTFSITYIPQTKFDQKSRFVLLLILLINGLFNLKYS
ncbi:MAG: hypothetical protein ACRCUP_00140 [Mycoplasmatales bacterium]